MSFNLKKNANGVRKINFIQGKICLLFYPLVLNINSLNILFIYLFVFQKNKTILSHFASQVQFLDLRRDSAGE